METFTSKSITIRFRVTYFLLLVVLLISAPRAHGLTDLEEDDDFCYHTEDCGPDSDKWTGACHIGNQQSPIDLKYPDGGSTKAKNAILGFNDKYSSPDFYIRNNGHTVQVTLQEGPNSNGIMHGYGFDNPYIFAQIHFHWGENNSFGSEHTLEDFHFPLEVHLVHYNSKYSSFSAAVESDDPTSLAALGLFLIAGSEEDVNPGFDTIADYLPLSYQPEAEHINRRLDLSSLLPKEGQTFFRYHGSLTTPPCNEAVEWTVITKPIPVKPSEITKFREVLDHHNVPMGLNYRPVQPLGKRKLEYLYMEGEFNSASGLNLTYIWLCNFSVIALSLRLHVSN